MATAGDGNLESKRERNEEVAVDRISDLPESVLLHILSFLPALSVVRTSVLSRTWQHLWTCVPSLDFDYENFKDFKDGKSHVNFVNEFLLRHKAGSIQKFRINTIPDNSHDAEEWIKVAIDRNVEELGLRFPYYGDHLSLQLPQTIFGCKTLVVLKLEGHLVSMTFPPKARLPSLKTLNLDLCRSPYPEFENKLVSCCVVLEKLSIRRRRYDSGRKGFRVNAHKLKQLEIEFCSSSIPYQNDIGYVIDINAPALEDLDIKDSGSCSLLLANVGALSKAKIRLNDSNALQSLLNSFPALKNVKSLSLSSGYTQQTCNLEPEPTVQQYMNLTHLTLGVNGVWVQLLPHFFHCFPNLQVLRLMKETLIRSCISWNLCTDPELLPSDLLSRLRVFEAEEIRETPEELAMLKYIVKNSKALELVQIHNLEITERYIVYTTRRGAKEQKLQACEEERRKIELEIRLAQRILGFPRASHKCQIKFS